MRLAEAQIAQLPFQRTGGAYAISGFEVRKQGLDVRDVSHVLRIQPDGWQQFVASMPDDWTLEGHEAIAFVREFERFVRDRDVDVAIGRLAEGRDTLDKLRDSQPELLAHPQIRKVLASWSPRIRRGAPRGGRPSREELELYFYVKLLEGKIPRNEAIRRTLRMHRKWIPKKWKSNPFDSLRKAVQNRDREQWFYSKPR